MILSANYTAILNLDKLNIICINKIVPYEHIKLVCYTIVKKIILSRL